MFNGFTKSRSREDKRALNLGFIFRPQTRYIQYFDEGLNRSSVSAFGEIYLDSFVPKHLQRKINGQMKLTSNVSRGA